MVEYDKHYKKADYFGNSYKELVQFFAEYRPKGKVLDLGCGQGRDAIEIAKLGYKVTGVDISKVGINQMIEKSEDMNLEISGIVEDIYEYSKINDFDFVVLDSMFHFYKKDKLKETDFLKKILDEMKMGSILCNFLLKSKAKELYFKSIINDSNHDFEILRELYIKYPEANCEYQMLVIKKITK